MVDPSGRDSMSKTVVVGASGFAGGHIVRELEKRGHQVTKVNRHGGDDTVRGDVTDTGAVRELIPGADAVVLAIRAFEDGREPLLLAIENLIEAGVPRLAVVGGAGSLLRSDGTRVADSPSFPDAAKPEAAAQARVLERLRGQPSDIDWFYVSPTSMFGARAGYVRPRGTYRTLQDDLVVDADGGSHIAGEDFALAFVDELEVPHRRRQRFSVGY
jgi:putative NADH-flavin reductase